MAKKWVRALNPFEPVLFEGEYQPGTQSLQTGLGDKVAQAFLVINGAPKNDTQRTPSGYRPGIFDYLTLGTFAAVDLLNDFLIRLLLSLIETMMTRISDDNTPIPIWKRVLSGVMVGLLAIPLGITSFLDMVGNKIIRPILSLVLTGISLPVVFISHLITNKIKENKIHKLADAFKKNNSSTQNILSKLNDIPLDRIKCKNVEKIAENNSEDLLVTIELSDPKEAPSFTLFDLLTIDKKPKETIKISKELFNQLAEVNGSARECFLKSQDPSEYDQNDRRPFGMSPRK